MNLFPIHTKSRSFSILTAVGSLLLAATGFAPAAHAADSGSMATESRTEAFTPRKSFFGGPGYFNLAAGLSHAGGLRADNTMVNLTGGYNVDVSPTVAGKVLADLNIASGTETTRFIDLAVGANYYAPNIQSATMKPYIGGDIGVGFVRSNTDRNATGAAIGATAGFQYLLDLTNVDVSLRYEALTTQIQGAVPQVVSLRGGVDF